MMITSHHSRIHLWTESINTALLKVKAHACALFLVSSILYRLCLVSSRVASTKNHSCSHMSGSDFA